jgi:hypothetical protein
MKDEKKQETTIQTEEEIKPLVLQNGIFVVGHPRSGTSLACKLLESAGVHFPSDLGADQYNLDGYFELSTAKELEKKLIEEAMTAGNISELNKVVKILNQGKGLTGLKIVHIPSLFFYRHIAKKNAGCIYFQESRGCDVQHAAAGNFTVQIELVPQQQCLDRRSRKYPQKHYCQL